MLGKRLKMLRKEYKLTQKDLANLIGVTPKAISFYELEERQPSHVVLMKMAKYFNVTTDYLLGQDEKPAPVVRRIPVLGSVVAGIPIEAIQDIEDYEEIKSTMGDPRDYFALRVRGRSMEPRLMDGDTIIVKKQEDVDSGQTAVVLINGGEGTVKQVKKSPKGILLIGFNQSVYEPHFYTNEEIMELPIRIAGVVVESRHKW